MPFLCVTSQIESIRSKISQLFKKAASADCKLICLPECFAYIGSGSQAAKEAAQPIKSDLVDAYRDLCAKHKIWASFGGFHEKTSDPDGRIGNAHLIVNSQGTLLLQSSAMAIANLLSRLAGREL